MSAKTATIIGVTGLIGSKLLPLLVRDPSYQRVRLLVRRPYKINHSKVEVKLIDFSDHESFKLGIDGSNTVFCAIGTTQQKVKGNQAAYRKVDYDIAVNAARYCKETRCNNFVLVSSVGANAESNNFYLKLKGEIEEGVKRYSLESVSIFRPSVLLGNRNESRPGERIAQIGMTLFSFAFIGSSGKYKPVPAPDVAAAMLLAAKKEAKGVALYEYNEIKSLARER